MMNEIINICKFIENWQSTNLVILILLSILILIIIKRYLADKRKILLSYKIQEAKCKLIKKKSVLLYLEDIIYQLKQFYYPTLSRLGFLIFVIAGLIIFFIKVLPILPAEDLKFYETLVPIQIGIAMLVFPVMIFIIGFSGKKPTAGTNLSEVLLHGSYLFPVGVTILCFLVSLIWTRHTYVIMAQMFITALLYVFVLFQIVQLMLDDSKYIQKSKELLKDKLRRSLEKAIEERLGNNIIFQSLGENKIELQYQLPDIEDRNEEYLKYQLNRKGVITDVNMANLEKIAKLIEVNSKNNGFSFYKNILDLSKESTEQGMSNIPVSKDQQEPKEDKDRYLQKRFMDVVSEERAVVLCFQKKIISDENVLREIDSLVQRTFIIKSVMEASDKLRIELRNLKDQMIEDIHNKRLGRIDSLKEIYIALNETFMDILHKYSSNYTMEMARKERGNIFNEWQEVGLLMDDLREIYEIALQSHERNIIRKIAYIPIAIANHSIKIMDHYIFQKSFQFLSLFYMYALQEKDNTLQEFMKDRCGIYLKETADYYIQYELGKLELGKDKIQQYKDFAIEILFQLQHLSKQAYDAKDIKTFEKFIKIGKELFRHFSPSEEHPSLSHLEWELELKLPDLDEEQKNKIKNKLDDKKFLEGIEREIKERKEELFFGLASYLLDEYKAEKGNKEKLKFFEVINAVLPTDLQTLTRLFLRCYSFEMEHYWGWNWWILVCDEEVHSIDFLGKIVWLYCFKCLQLLPSLSNDQIKNTKLDYNRDFVHMIEKEDSPIKVMLKEIVEKKDEWKGILPDNVDTKYIFLYDSFNDAKKRQITEEEDLLIKSELSNKKINEFVTGFLKGYQNNSFLHSLIKEYGDFNDRSTAPYRGPLSSIGYNRLDEKGAFLESWHVHYSQWGNQYGRSMANSENNYIFEKLKKDVIILNSSNEGIVEKVENAVKDLIDCGYIPNVIITTLDFKYYGNISSHENFLPYWHKNCRKSTISNYQGILKTKYRTIPVFRYFTKGEKNLICILDIKKRASLYQYNPINTEDKSNYLKDCFYIRVFDLNKEDELRKKILDSNPDWLNKHADKERYLRQKVVVKTFMRQELVPKESNASRVVKVV